MNQQLSVFNYSFTNKSDDEIDVHIDGYIVDAPTQEIMKEYWGDETSVSYKSFRNQIEAAKPKIINLFVNSGGGHVGDAMAMHDYLEGKESDGVTINRNGIGIVASAATYLIMGKNSSMSANSWFMIHNVSGGIWGDVNVIENYAKTMRKFNNQVRDFYSNSTGLPPEQVSALMNKESWLTAKEAKEKGFVKNITGETKFSNTIKPEQWQFQNTAVLNAYNSFTKNNDVHMDANKITEAISNGFKNLKEALGIKDKENDDAVKNAFKEFAEGITNSIKENIPQPVTDEKITELVNKVLGTEAVKNTIAEQVKNAVDEKVKDAPSADAMKNEVKTEVKNQLKTVEETLTNSIVEKMGEGAGEGKKKNEKKTGAKNRFAGADYGDFENK